MSPPSPQPPQQPPPPRQQQQQPTIWSHEETLTLIKSYEHICTSLNIRHLNSTHWQHISQTLPTLSKTPTQCRHKLDTLRKRYRSETSKLPLPSSWVYFPLLQRLEHLQHNPTYDNNINAYVNHHEPSSIDHTINNNNHNKRRRKGCELASVMRDFVESFVKVEEMKMEVIRENERFKIEMENKRLQMILLSHQKSVDFISNTLGFNN